MYLCIQFETVLSFKRTIWLYWLHFNFVLIIKTVCQLCKLFFFMDWLKPRWIWKLCVVYTYNRKEIKLHLPKLVLDLNDWTPHQWMQVIHLKSRQLENLSATEAKKMFLGNLGASLIYLTRHSMILVFLWFCSEITRMAAVWVNFFQC